LNDRLEFVERDFDENILPALSEFVSIPNMSPAFDPGNDTIDETEKVIRLVSSWTVQHCPEAQVSVLRKPGLWPLMLIDVPGTSDSSVLCYAHLDKQPPMRGWREGLSSRSPVVEGRKLFGRGAVDDGYAAFAYLSALRALARERKPRPRCLLVLETTEESFSIHLPPYFGDIFNAIDNPSLIVCLDSVCGDYERLWYTTSIRGSVVGNLNVRVLKEGLHSGHGGGITPSAFRLLTGLINRLEDQQTGVMRDPLFGAEIPTRAIELLGQAADILQDRVVRDLGLLPGVEPMTSDPLQALLNQTWRPSLTVIGLDGLAQTANAGNELVPEIAAKLSIRLSPTAKSAEAAQKCKQLCEANAPYNAPVSFDVIAHADGWWCGKFPAWLTSAANDASLRHFGMPSAPIAVGGGIPFIKPLADAFPAAPIFVAGLIGPEANAHGPNESLDIPACKNLTACLADILEAAASHS